MGFFKDLLGIPDDKSDRNYNAQIAQGNADWQKNATLQYDFAKHGVGWHADDAIAAGQKHGVNKLTMLGVPSQSASPININRPAIQPAQPSGTGTIIRKTAERVAQGYIAQQTGINIKLQNDKLAKEIQLMGQTPQTDVYGNTPITEQERRSHGVTSETKQMQDIYKRKHETIPGAYYIMPMLSQGASEPMETSWTNWAKNESMNMSTVLKSWLTGKKGAAAKQPVPKGYVRTWDRKYALWLDIPYKHYFSGMKGSNYKPRRKNPRRKRPTPKYIQKLINASKKRRGYIKYQEIAP